MQFSQINKNLKKNSCNSVSDVLSLNHSKGTDKKSKKKRGKNYDKKGNSKTLRNIQKNS